MTCEIREICGDWALDMNFPFETVTIYFNSRQNAETVKKIIETDRSIPNAATVCDMQGVVRCKDCINADKHPAKVNKKGFLICAVSGMEITGADYCSYGERKGGCENG